MGLAELQNGDSKLISFLNEEISISVTARQSASTSQNYLRNVLRNKENTDLRFPNLLQRQDADFIGGSFGRHTKIWPLDDIDLFLPLDGGGLNYIDSGFRLPFTLTTDGIPFNRLLRDPFLSNGYIDSNKVLTHLSDSLCATYPSSTVDVDQHCVNIRTQIQATSESDGIGFDVVPCFRLTPDQGGRDFYLVPNGSGDWMRTDPRYDNELCEDLHRYSNKHFRKAVRLVKYWNKHLLADVFRSYYLELALMKRFAELRAEGRRSDSLCGALYIGFSAIQTAYGNGAIESFTSEAPAVKPPVLSYTQRSVLDVAVTRCAEAYVSLSQRGNQRDAMEQYNSLFGTEFFS